MLHKGLGQVHALSFIGNLVLKKRRSGAPPILVKVLLVLRRLQHCQIPQVPGRDKERDSFDCLLYQVPCRKRNQFHGLLLGRTFISFEEDSFHQLCELEKYDNVTDKVQHAEQLFDHQTSPIFLQVLFRRKHPPHPNPSPREDQGHPQLQNNIHLVHSLRRVKVAFVSFKNRRFSVFPRFLVLAETDST